MLISIHELTLTCKNSKKIALNSREVGVPNQSRAGPAGQQAQPRTSPTATIRGFSVIRRRL